jgi:hypothetical protein
VWPFAIERFDSLAIQENVSVAHSTEGSVGPIAALDALEKSNIISFPCRKQKGGSSVAHIVAQSQYLSCRLRFYNPITIYNFFGA